MNPNLLLKSVDQTLAVEGQAIHSLRSTLSKEAVLKVIEAIRDCSGRIVVTGCGTSGVAAKKIVHSLCCIERPACYLNPSDAVHGELGLVQRDDVVIFISKGGKTAELMNVLAACRAKGALLIAVTENEDSVLAKDTDILLKVAVEKEPDPFNMLATASTLAVISLFDAIVIALMHETSYTKEQFALIHPGGAVGERLLGSSRD